MDAEIQNFIFESQETLSELDHLVINLHDSPDDDDLINAIYRPFHSLKGAAGFFGFTNVNQIAHKAENLLSALRKKEIRMTDQITDSILLGRDILADIFVKMLEDENATALLPEHERYLENLDDILQSNMNEGSIEDQDESLAILAELKIVLSPNGKKPNGISKTEPVLKLMRDARAIIDSINQKSKSTEAAKEYFFKDEEISEEINTLLRSVAKIKTEALSSEESDAFNKAHSRLKEILRDLPNAVEEMAVVDPYLNFLDDEIVLLDETVYNQIASSLDAVIAAIEDSELGKVRKIGEILIEQGKITEKDVREAVETQQKIENILHGASDEDGPKAQSNGHEKYIRVNQDNVDTFVQQVADTAVLAESFNYSFTVLERMVDDRKFLSNLNDSIQVLENLTQDLQKSVLAIRQVPLKQLFNKLPRMVRELSKNLKSRVDLEIFGDDLAVDRNIVELLDDPLIHMIRNALDHGLEKNPMERLAYDKPEKGILKIGATIKEEYLWVTVQDDGCGIEVDAVLQKAIEKELTTESQADRMTESEIFNLIFAPGFSTAKVITDVSGRGVGMDVVRSNIEKLNGKIFVESELHKGTLFKIQIPLSQVLISQDALFFEAARESFAIPYESVVKILKTPANRVTTLAKDSLFMNLDGAPLALMPFESLVVAPDQRKEVCKRYAECDTGELVTVVIEYRKQLYGIIVDQLLPPQRIVVKPLSGVPESGREIFAGISIQGDGEMALVLSANKLIQKIIHMEDEIA